MEIQTNTKVFFYKNFPGTLNSISGERFQV